MDIVYVIAIGVIGALFSAVLKQYKPEFAIAVSIVTSMIILIGVIGWIIPIISEIKDMMNRAEISYSYISILIKAVGICYITQFASDVCKDSGQTAIASKIELAGRIAICVSALPLFADLLSLVETIIGKVT